MSADVSGSRRECPCKLKPQAIVSHLVSVLRTEFEFSVTVIYLLSLSYYFREMCCIVIQGLPLLQAN